MMSAPHVVILADESLLDGAKSICTQLDTKFGISETTIRSTSVPSDRLLATIRSLSECSVVFAVLAAAAAPDGERAAAALSVCELLERESPSPIVRIDNTSLTSQAAASASAFDRQALQIARACTPASTSVRSAVVRHLSSARQAALIRDIQVQTESAPYIRKIQAAFDGGKQITGDAVDFGGSSSSGGSSSAQPPPPVRISGKVRDRYDLGDRLALVTTDRQSGFDRMLALVPYKGAVLNLTSAHWFERTAHIIPNHLIAVPHPNVSVVKKCTPFPIEFVVRSYMTGSTSTSIWKNYQDGVRNYCGHELPEGMTKNQKLWKNLLTPTTKEEEHDRPISAADIVSEGWMTAEDYAVCGKAALEVFELGQKLAAERGLILVDTKYEMGKDADGTIVLIDEVHTPDSSRYWLASSYEDRIREGKEPENIDKEFLRLWFREHCDPYKDEVLPQAPRDLVVELSRRYISLYEMITWKEFEFDESAEGQIADAIQSSVGS